MKKSILWRSDLWRFSLAFAFVGLSFAVLVAFNVVGGRSGEAFGEALVALSWLTVAVGIAFIDRSEALRRNKAFPRRQALPLAKTIAWQHSCLNPDNLPPGKRNPPPGMIG